jgi:hypothetical protein
MTAGLLMALVGMISLSGCGGGGGGEGTPAPQPATQPTSAVLNISTQGTLPGGTQIGGLDVTLALPAGVTVKSVTSPPETDSGVVVTSGVAAANSTVLSTYTAAAGASAGKVRVLLANPNGFGTGEFMTIHCDIAPGNTPTASDFILSGFVASDLNGVAISGLNSAFTAAFQ